MIKIYFGRQPDANFQPLDDIFAYLFVQENYHYGNAVDRLVDQLNAMQEGNYWTVNPLIPNFMDDDVTKELFWIIDEKGCEIHFKADEALLKKLDFMQPGEALCDDARSFQS